MNFSYFNSKVLNEEMQCAQKKEMNDFPVKLVEPSKGRVVELQITEKNDFTVKLYMDQLTNYAKSMEQFGVQWKIIGKTVRLTFSDSNMAEDARQTWRK